MTEKLPEPKWENESMTECLELWRQKLQRHYEERLDDLGDDVEWADIVNNHHEYLLGEEELERLDDEIVSEGYRYDPAANVSYEEAPEKYEEPGEL